VRKCAVKLLRAAAVQPGEDPEPGGEILNLFSTYRRPSLALAQRGAREPPSIPVAGPGDETLIYFDLGDPPSPSLAQRGAREPPSIPVAGPGDETLIYFDLGDPPSPSPSEGLGSRPPSRSLDPETNELTASG